MIPTDIKRLPDTPTCHHQAMVKTGKGTTNPVSNVYGDGTPIHAEVRSLFDWVFERLREK